jgi:hypothetical protein
MLTEKVVPTVECPQNDSHDKELLSEIAVILVAGRFCDLNTKATMYMLRRSFPELNAKESPVYPKTEGE